MVNGIPLRSVIPVNDTWDLSSLFIDDAAWERALAEYDALISKLGSFRGMLGGSAASLADWLDFQRDMGILAERLAYYSELRQTEDGGDDAARVMAGKFVMAAARAEAEASFAAPEIQAVPDDTMSAYLESPRLADYTVYLRKLLRYKPYILSEKEERVIAVQGEADGAVREVFSVLTNVDIDFGVIDTAEGPRPLSQSTWSVFMESGDRVLREKAYRQFYRQFDCHKTTLAALYSASVKKDVIHARLRGYSSARAAALFPDNVDERVYDNLIATVHANLAPLHKYYGIRRRALGLDRLGHYDVYVPLAQRAAKKTRWDEAVTLVSGALEPLGAEYVDTLRAGLLGRWADRYENKGKRAGAFSAGSYTGEPYILMNYKEDSIRDVFTLAHEGGHSMHSWYSARNNPFMHYNYTIFEAEVASTFNEELLYRHLQRQYKDDAQLGTYLLCKRADDILATLYRQTMFAEFELKTHHLEESGQPLAVERLRSTYRALLEQYFGPGMELEPESDLEGLRIPHFYNAFYVYKYATGISAALALAERVAGGGTAERDDYFRFLKSGGSHFPLESLKMAGVDMASPAPVEAACAVFARIVDELDTRFQEK
ncbi:MAG: oligoendopeptidase F [Spirochaetaceae bacterium]|jgi:oligoendopeptidase F|nr:oligoendopeptidase F [Spirochaetaceae bacterium]